MLLGQDVGKSAKKMAFFVRMLIALSLACSHWCSAEEGNQGLWALEVKSRFNSLKAKSDDGKNSGKETPIGKKIRRSTSSSDRTDIVTTMNNLRRTVGSSNMPYMTYSARGESDAASWTSFCNYDMTFYGSDSVCSVQQVSPDSQTIPAILRDLFNSYSRALSSVYLTSLGCDQRMCSRLRYNGSSYRDAQLTLCVFQGGSQFDDKEVQYKLGEGCTECDSGSFWCDYGLCRDCNSYCLNGANTYTDRTTCRCQCLEGWTGSRCETGSATATTPNCTTTARTTTTTTTTTTTALVTRVINTFDPQSSNSIVYFGTSVLQFTLCAIMAFLLRQ